MYKQQGAFAEHDVLHALKHHLPAQAPLKDFIHHNTLHNFQHLKFYDALNHATKIFGYKTTLSLNDYRKLFEEGKIKDAAINHLISERKAPEQLQEWKQKLVHHHYEYHTDKRINKVRAYWKSAYRIDLDSLVHPFLFRLVCSYLDQGIAIWNFPVEHKGFLASLRELERINLSSIFKTKRAAKLLLDPQCNLQLLLKTVVGDESLFEQYLYDQQFAHQGWSGLVSVIEDQPNALLDPKNISLHDFILFELLLEIDALDNQFGENWKPLAEHITEKPEALFAPINLTELDEVIALWQDAYEWSYYDEVLTGIKNASHANDPNKPKSFQAMFCIDDRECSLRRYIEKLDPDCETLGTPGFFGVEFYYQPKDGKFLTKVCPAPVTPKHVIREIHNNNTKKNEVHFTKHTHTLFPGWIISQTLGFWSAVRLFFNVFKPSAGPATTSSFGHMDKFSTLTIEHTGSDAKQGDLQEGFTIDEMVNRVEGLLKSIGMVKNFAPLVYVIGHGASSINNTHYAGYDCGACSGRPGSVNARVLSFMANHPKVRAELKFRSIGIPDGTRFVGGLHDTTRDEIEFYDEEKLSESHDRLHINNKALFQKALDDNAKERSRRFMLIDTKASAKKIHEKVKLRSVSLFEPRPELNHATNALCIIGRRTLNKHMFLDRRAFLNSYDYSIDPEGALLKGVIRPIGPVCGGINLEYYFSRVDNQKLGAGTKLPHNVMGLIGVANGTDGDLRAGLPNQMIEVHDPVRLMLIVEHYPGVVLNALQQSPETYEWYANEWVHVASVNPDTGQITVLKNGAFVPYHSLNKASLSVNDVSELVETTEENLPVYLITN